jgi:NAD(P)H-dependent FMN reductase
VGFVSYGGMGGGLRAVEELRLGFAELHAVTVRDSVSFRGAWAVFDENREPLDQIEWWGTTLRDARAVRPYAA